MKQPNMSDPTINCKGTKRMRTEAAHTRKVKITINIGLNSLDSLREMVGRTDAPYQQLLNRILREGLRKRGEVESRLNRIERELARLRKQLA